MSIDQRRGQFSGLSGVGRRDAKDAIPSTPIYFHERPADRPMADELGEPTPDLDRRKSKLPKDFGLRKF